MRLLWLWLALLLWRRRGLGGGERGGGGGGCSAVVGEAFLFYWVWWVFCWICEYLYFQNPIWRPAKGVVRAKASLIHQRRDPRPFVGRHSHSAAVCQHIAQPRFAFLVAIRLAHETVVKESPSINTARHRPPQYCRPNHLIWLDGDGINLHGITPCVLIVPL